MNNKACNLQIKGLDFKNRIVEGYFASFNTIDSDNDMFVKGAFEKSILENGPNSASKRIKHLFNHWDTAGVIQELTEDATGLRYVSKIGNHTLGSDVLNMYQDGIITEHSVGFQTIRSENDLANKYTILQEVKLWEGSSLDKWGANMNTPVIKSLDEFKEWSAHWEKRFDTLTKALRGRTNYTDETYDNLEIQIMQLKDAFKLALNQVQPLKDTVVIEPQKEVVEVAKEINFDLLTNYLKQ